MVDDRARRLTLIACILGSSIVFVDQTVVNVALPSLRDDLRATLADQQWVVEAYLLLLASLVLGGGALGDLYGRRRIFAIGVSGFGAASLVCAAAPSVEVLATSVVPCFGGIGWPPGAWRRSPRRPAIAPDRSSPRIRPATPDHRQWTAIRTGRAR